MVLALSSVATADAAAQSAHFSARRLDLQALTGFINPVMGFDHFRMSGPTFSPHPHAGFSAVSYVFEDSSGALRNRDSLGNDLSIEPGAMVWTQAGSGVVHDEFPARPGKEVHGLQLFVNLSRAHKGVAPRMLHAPAGVVPQLEVPGGSRIRVLAGAIGDVRGPIEPIEPFDFLDIELYADWIYDTSASRNGLVYVVSGQLEVSSGPKLRSLSAHQAIAFRAPEKGGRLHLKPMGPTRVVLLSGVDPKEPVVSYGPFIMSSQQELKEAYARYLNGQMGRLPPPPHSP